jgi:broad-specificity NMP kinase
VTGRVLVLAGAPGAGKSTLVAALVETGCDAVVVDADELLDADGTLLGVPIADPWASETWPAYDRLWGRIAELVTRSGHDLLLVGPFDHGQLPVRVAAWAHLDCDDDVRAERLRSRGWEDDRIAEAVADAADLRATVARRFDTTTGPIEAVAADVAAWLGRDTAPGDVPGAASSRDER